VGQHAWPTSAVATERRSRGWKWLVTASQLAGLWVPDASIGFWKAARPADPGRGRTLRPPASSSPRDPVSGHDPELWLARTLGLPWAADFHDLYLIDRRYAPRGIGRLRLAAHRAYEGAVYRHSCLCIHATPLHARCAQRVYPQVRDKIRILTNG
jgi:hypothetical protein